MTNDAGTIQVYDLIHHQDNSAGFQPLGGANPAVNIGLKWLCGCTGLFVVNPGGVYYAHYFESPSFDTDANFQTQVIDFLGSPALVNGFPGLLQYQTVFNSRDTRIYILTPEDENAPTTAQYAARMVQIRTAINGIIPLAPNAVEYLYVAPESTSRAGRYAMRSTVQGRALFQYDSGNTPPMRLYFETNLQPM
ncbi:hypothetical protein GP486_005097 [Trichoglossum hirsutum]|uniref:Uncharacterized protein n=1 Tax=Trichoglossum hirsutum TaxID=265104 RepID=A0A9P8L9U9_9PEZI|nr:hypothetical protein GP486_005097 [Trichoglossum hirsutum]